MTRLEAAAALNRAECALADAATELAEGRCLPTAVRLAYAAWEQAVAAYAAVEV